MGSTRPTRRRRPPRTDRGPGRGSGAVPSRDSGARRERTNLRGVRVVSGDGVAPGRALVVGVTGISGGNLARRLLAEGWEVTGLCRNPDSLDPRITPLTANLEDPEAVSRAVDG